MTDAVVDVPGTAPAPDATEVFEEFYVREFNAVVTLAYVLCGDLAAAEDLAQEGFLIAHRKWNRISGYDKPDAWIRRVVANLAVSAIRRRAVEAKVLLRLARRDPPAAQPVPASDEEFWSAVRKLPNRQAQVVALHYLEDLSVARVAELLECAEGTVKAHLHRARNTLAQHLGAVSEDEA